MASTTNRIGATLPVERAEELATALVDLSRRRSGASIEYCRPRPWPENRKVYWVRPTFRGDAIMQREGIVDLLKLA